MKNKYSIHYTITISILILTQISCSKDKTNVDLITVPKIEVIEGTLGTVTYNNRNLVSTDYVLVNDALKNRVFLMDKNAELVHEWPLNGNRLGNDAYLQNNGQLLIMLESKDPKIEFGGFGGVIQLLDKEGNIKWNFDYSTDDYILHHDAEMLPNGNILAQVWERKTQKTAKAMGSKYESDIFPEAIIEINPSTNEIVWEWHVWDHIIQDFDDKKENYGIIANNPMLVDLNYVSIEDGDIMHANGLDYDETSDVIYLSVNFFSEIWVIDHSTTTEEAASHEGGQYNNGGDLIYRFGNPDVYDNTTGTTLFDHNHRPNLLNGNDQGNMLVYSNGFSGNQSTVYELKLPANFVLNANQNNEPDVVWSFTDPDLFSPKVSGAERLPNGNTLITEGDFGIWEVTNTGEIVWKFTAEGFFWRSYDYVQSSEAIKNLGI